MNFLFIKAKGSYIDIPWALAELGYSVDIFREEDFDPNNMEESRYPLVRQELLSHTYSAVISYIFLPEISDICQSLSIPYISWTYDSPLVSLFSSALYNDCNFTFLFDKSEYNYFKNKNVPHLYYLPMAVNTSRTGTLNISAEDEARFSHEVSFIGGMYENNTYNQLIGRLPEQFQLELKSYLVHNLCKWDEVKSWPCLSDELTQYLIDNVSAGSWIPYDMPANLYFGILILSRKLGEMDRLTVLNTLNEIVPVDLYTKSESLHIQNLRLHSGVSYSTDMNKVFYLSRINLNITLPSIETGLPQRIFDIMGDGGFMLTNYQDDIDELFTIGKEIEVFHNLDELKDKTTFYLNHETERLRIAMAGYQRVQAEHTYLHRMRSIISIVEEALS